MLKTFEEYDKEHRQPNPDSDQNRVEWLISMHEYNHYATDYTLNSLRGKTVDCVQSYTPSGGGQSHANVIIRFTDGTAIKVESKEGDGLYTSDLSVRPYTPGE